MTDVPFRFLLAYLHYESISNQHNLSKLRLSLDSLPQKLDDVYEETFERIRNSGSSEDYELAYKAIAWIIFAARPLTLRELQYAIISMNLKRGDKEFDTDSITTEGIILSTCMGLMVVDSDTTISMPYKKVRLVHYTTQEYLLKVRDTLFTPFLPGISVACLRYRRLVELNSFIPSVEEQALCTEFLKVFQTYNPEFHSFIGRANVLEEEKTLYSLFPSHSIVVVKLLEKLLESQMRWVLDELPFYQYAVQSWANHLRGEMECAFQEEILEYVECITPYYRVLLALTTLIARGYDIPSQPGKISTIQSSVGRIWPWILHADIGNVTSIISPLGTCAKYGLLLIAKRILQNSKGSAATNGSDLPVNSVEFL